MTVTVSWIFAAKHGRLRGGSAATHNCDCTLLHWQRRQSALTSMTESALRSCTGSIDRACTGNVDKALTSMTERALCSCTGNIDRACTGNLFLWEHERSEVPAGLSHLIRFPFSVCLSHSFFFKKQKVRIVCENFLSRWACLCALRRACSHLAFLLAVHSVRLMCFEADTQHEAEQNLTPCSRNVHSLSPSHCSEQC